MWCPMLLSLKLQFHFHNKIGTEVCDAALLDRNIHLKVSEKCKHLLILTRQCEVLMANISMNSVDDLHIKIRVEERPSQGRR